MAWIHLRGSFTAGLDEFWIGHVADADGAALISLAVIVASDQRLIRIHLGLSLLNRLHATTSYTLDPIHLGLTFLNSRFVNTTKAFVHRTLQIAYRL